MSIKSEPRISAPGEPATHSYRGVRGAARVLVVVYGILALAALGRSSVQLLGRFEEAPIAYSLSALAAVVYVVATVALIMRGELAYRIAWAAVCFEFLGVIVIGSISVLVPELFPSDTVWSDFGRGYLFIPLVLPLFGIAWLESQRKKRKEVASVHRD